MTSNQGDPEDGAPRRPHRVPLHVPVRCHVIGEGWCEGWTENISRTGALIRTSRPIALGAEMDLVLTVPPGLLNNLAGEIICGGTVVRLAPAQGQEPVVGVMFRKCRPTVASRSL